MSFLGDKKSQQSKNEYAGKYVAGSFSMLATLSRVGLLMAFTLFTALLADLILTPALLTWVGEIKEKSVASQMAKAGSMSIHAK